MAEGIVSCKSDILEELVNMNFEQMSLFDLIPTDPETPGEGGLHETKPVKDVVHGVSYSLEPVEGYLEVRNL